MVDFTVSWYAKFIRAQVFSEGQGHNALLQRNRVRGWVLVGKPMFF